MDVANCEECHLAPHVNWLQAYYQSAVDVSSDKKTCDQQELCTYGPYFKQRRCPL